MKHCPKCKRDDVEFGRSRTRKDGLNGWCKACYRAATARYLADPEYAERQRAQKRARRAENPEAAAARSKAWRAAHPKTEAERVTKRAWKRRNPEKMAAYRNTDAHRATMRRAKVRRLVGRDEEAVEYALLVLAGDPCSYCPDPADSVDHIVAVAAGGGNGWPNLTAACRACNGRKQARSLLSFLTTEAA